MRTAYPKRMAVGGRDPRIRKRPHLRSSSRRRAAQRPPCNSLPLLRAFPQYSKNSNSTRSKQNAANSGARRLAGSSSKISTFVAARSNVMSTGPRCAKCKGQRPKHRRLTRARAKSAIASRTRAASRLVILKPFKCSRPTRRTRRACSWRLGEAAETYRRTLGVRRQVNLRVPSDLKQVIERSYRRTAG